RRDGGDREHPPQPRPREAAHARHRRRRAADRDPRVRVDALDLHRLPADLRALGAGGGALPPARPRRGLRDGGLVLPVAPAAAAGTRLEETELLFAQVEKTVRATIPREDLGLVLDNIGLSTYGVALAIGSNATVGPADGDMMVQLTPEHRGSTWEYVRTLRKALPKQFPGVTFFFQPADMVNQVLNLGLPAPID